MAKKTIYQQPCPAEAEKFESLCRQLREVGQDYERAYRYLAKDLGPEKAAHKLHSILGGEGGVK